MKIEVSENTTMLIAISILLSGLATIATVLIATKEITATLTELQRLETIQVLGQTNELYDKLIKNADAANGK